MYGVSPSLLKAMATVESSLRPGAMNADHLLKTRSVDIGLMQINSRWKPHRSWVVAVCASFGGDVPSTPT